MDAEVEKPVLMADHLDRDPVGMDHRIRDLHRTNEAGTNRITTMVIMTKTITTIMIITTKTMMRIMTVITKNMMTSEEVITTIMVTSAVDHRKTVFVMVAVVCEVVCEVVVAAICRIAAVEEVAVVVAIEIALTAIMTGATKVIEMDHHATVATAIGIATIVIMDMGLEAAIIATVEICQEIATIEEKVIKDKIRSL